MYAPAQYKEKEWFWIHLFQINSVIDLPWCLIGDFNELANLSEKKGGQRYTLSKFEKLNYFMNTINAVSVPCSEHLFTWKKKIRSSAFNL